ncbi:MAG: HNH endonuclease [Planctomycetota bacterium]
MEGFEYPPVAHVRRHGPAGYDDYASYRDWLRDEFTFRCVFCLHREQWYGRSGTFDIEHFVPTSVDPDGECEYSNLFYACRTCNTAKSDILAVPDPCAVAFGDCLRIKMDGEVEALNADGRKLLGVLRLNSLSNVQQRSRWMRNLRALRESDPELYAEYMAFPAELPDLRRKRVPSNTKPAGVLNCYFALQERGELPAGY